MPEDVEFRGAHGAHQIEHISVDRGQPVEHVDNDGEEHYLKLIKDKVKDKDFEKKLIEEGLDDVKDGNMISSEEARKRAEECFK